MRESIRHMARAGLLALCLTMPVAAKEMVDLQVPDYLARPDDDIVLTAKLEENGPRGADIEKALVEWRLDGKVLGHSKTDDDGVAVWRVQAGEPGDHVVKVVYEGDESYFRAEYSGLLAVRKPDQKILVLDIDWTISMTDNLNTAFGGADSPPIKDAPEVVTRLAADYLPVYVTARARQLRKRTISWLHRYGFPRGPSFFLNPKQFPTYNEAKYKKTVLQPMKAAFPNLVAGIGNKESDVEAYQAVQIPSILITERNVAGATCVKEWKLVEGAIGGK